MGESEPFLTRMGHQISWYCKDISFIMFLLEEDAKSAMLVVLTRNTCSGKPTFWTKCVANACDKSTICIFSDWNELHHLLRFLVGGASSSESGGTSGSAAVAVSQAMSKAQHFF